MPPAATSGACGHRAPAAAAFAVPLRLLLIAALCTIAGGHGRADLSGHGGMVRAVAVSADGGHVITASFDYTARLWSFADQRELGRLIGHTGPVNAAAFLPDGGRVITAGDDATPIVWDLRTMAATRRLIGHMAKVVAIAASPDGRHAASAGWDGTVRLWDLTTGTETHRLDHEAPVNAVVFDPAGGRLFTADRDGVISIWDAAGGIRQAVLPRHDIGIVQLAFVAGSRLLSAGVDGTLRLWDAASRQEIANFRNSEQPVHGIAAMPDGATALAGGLDGTLVHWSLTTGRTLRVFPAHEKPVWSVAITPDGRFALTASGDGSVRVWHIETGSRIGPAGDAPLGPEPWRTSTHPGAALYRACASCHALDPAARQGSGPHFAGLFGRPAGSVEGYPYSPALRRTDLVWDRRNLRALFERGPDRFVPGSKMPLQRIDNPLDLEALVDFLGILTAPASLPADQPEIR